VTSGRNHLIAFESDGELYTWFEEMYARSPLAGGISEPSDFVHKVHVGLDAVTGEYTVRFFCLSFFAVFLFFVTGCLGCTGNVERCIAEPQVIVTLCGLGGAHRDRRRGPLLRSRSQPADVDLFPISDLDDTNGRRP